MSKAKMLGIAVVGIIIYQWYKNQQLNQTIADTQNLSNYLMTNQSGSQSTSDSTTSSSMTASAAVV